MTEKTPDTAGRTPGRKPAAKAPGSPSAAKTATKPAAKAAAGKAVAKPAAAKATLGASARRAEKAAAAALTAAAGQVSDVAHCAAAEMRHLAGEAPETAKEALAVVSLKKKELIDRVVAASGAKKKAVKEIVEATLTVLGEALAKGEDLILPPFGKARVNRSRDTDGGTTMMVKLRQGGDQAAARKAARKGAKETLADPDD